MFRNRKLGTKMALSFTAMLVLLIVTVCIAIAGLLSVGDKVEKKDTVNRLVVAILKARQGEKNYVIRKDESHIAEVEQFIEYIISQAEDAKLEFTIETNRRLLDSLIRAAGEYRKAFRTFVNLERGKNPNISAQEQVSIDKEQKLADENMVMAAREVEDLCDEALKNQDDQLAELVKTSNLLFVLSILISVIAGTAFAFVTTRSMTGPLKAVIAIAEQIAAGNLRVNISHGDRKDEIGLLMSRFQHMVEKLREQMRQIDEASNIIASSSGEIASTSTQFASSMSETATSISETSSTTEELKQAAKLSNEKSQRVSQSAQGAVQVSQEGLKSTGDTIEGMKNMIAQMKAIAESIARLSDQNQAIGDIMVVIEDLAEQTNLLAVNAAIEAVRAGEQRKGFGVVAEEIRSLADQSKQATAQVKTILQNVQKAVGATVMTTEKGMNTADAGMKQSRETGDAIKKMVESIEKTSQTMLQIAASSQQQLVGVEQIAEAIANIKQASDQNSESAVQLEEAAKNLNQLGESLRNITKQYVL